MKNEQFNLLWRSVHCIPIPFSFFTSMNFVVVVVIWSPPLRRSPQYMFVWVCSTTYYSLLQNLVHRSWVKHAKNLTRPNHQTHPSFPPCNYNNIRYLRCTQYTSTQILKSSLPKYTFSSHMQSYIHTTVYRFFTHASAPKAKTCYSTSYEPWHLHYYYHIPPWDHNLPRWFWVWQWQVGVGWRSFQPRRWR